MLLYLLNSTCTKYVSVKIDRTDRYTLYELHNKLTMNATQYFHQHQFKHSHNLLDSLGNSQVNWLKNAASNREYRGICMSYPPKLATQAYVSTWFSPSVTLSSTALLTQHQLTHYDQMVATFRFKEQQGEGTLIFPIQRGSPYLTAVYQGILPFISTSNAILSINDQKDPGKFI